MKNLKSHHALMLGIGIGVIVGIGGTLAFQHFTAPAAPTTPPAAPKSSYTNQKK